NPLWTWYGVGSKRQHGSRSLDYYGFSLLPAGRWYAQPSFEWVGGYTFLFTSSNEYWQFSRADGDHRQVANSSLAQSLRCVKAYNLDQ
ncbi:MAG: hypothetical protein ACRCSB_01040, partial [Bacteroidales bacterium]